MEKVTLATAAIREQICPTCERRPPGSESLPADAARSCEAQCDLFVYLPRLTELVRRFGGEPPCGYESAVRSLPCVACTSGEPVACPAPCPRPLNRYAAEALAVVESIEKDPPKADDQG